MIVSGPHTAELSARALPGLGDSRPPAVVLGVGVTGLAVARSLARHGIEVMGVSDGPSLGAWSRRLRLMPGPRLLDDEALPYYVELGQRLPCGAVLIPTGDAGALFIGRHREELARYFHFAVPATPVLEALTSKRRLWAFAQRYDLPVPPTILPESRLDLERALDRLEFPCVIKPEAAHLWRSPAIARIGLRGTKAIPVAHPDDLLSWYDRLAAVDPRVVVQKMVRGPDENHLDYNAFIDHDGTIRAEFLGRKLRVFPAHYGSGSYVESIHCEETRVAGRAILERIGYRGVANLDFKRDEKDGRLYLLEINPRFWTWTALSVACGLDLPYYYYRDCLRMPYSVPPIYRGGHRWRHLLNDFRAMRAQARAGPSSWRRWIASAYHPSVNAVFAWDDPGPALMLLLRVVRDRLARPAERCEDDS